MTRLCTLPEAPTGMVTIPAGEFDFQAGLEQQHGLAGEEFADLFDDLDVVLGAVVGLRVLRGVVDGRDALGEIGLDAFLEGVARQREQRCDPLGDHIVLPHEVLPGSLRESESEEAFALLQPHELRDVRRRQPPWMIGGQNRK